ncbi:MAG: M23 family metallopeptidase [Puniceicoccaceae bacterium]
MAVVPRGSRVFRIGVLLACGVFLAPLLSAGRLPVVWPTPNRAFLEGKPIEDYVQPTVSGRIESGLFGCTRNGGTRFHEGIDLKTIGRDGRGRATDPVFAAMPGTVAHVNRVAGNSSYGIYVVLLHDYDRVRFYTLYAHLASVEPGLAPGTEVPQGSVLGIMGRTAAGYVIPRSRAHLHFEIGLRLSDHFERWYERKRFGSPNTHGPWNGMNLAGWDPLRFYRLSLDGRIDGARDFLLREPVAVRVRVAYPGIPGLVRRSPGLVEGGPGDRRGGWEVDFSSYGVPLRFRAVAAADLPAGSPEVEIVGFDAGSAFPPCRDLLEKAGDGHRPGADLARAIELIFGG